MGETEMTVVRRVAIYARVSTSGQTVTNQLRELEAWADRCGYVVVQRYRDEGISGTKGRDRRPQFDAMLKAVARREFDMVAAWSVDRLGRSLQDLIACLGDLQASKVDLFLHQQALDTSTPSGKAMFGMLGIFGEFEAAIIRERVNAGLARARAQGKTLGRPKISMKTEAAIRASLSAGTGIIKTAKSLKIGVSTVQRVKLEMAKAA
jgi:DNA invertase Pin-like site-specific DNA recombinase